MYFVAHMYSILKILPKKMMNEQILQPLIIGSWCPDAGYFPFFSPKLAIFDHQKKPPINLYEKDENKRELFELGWKLHLLCDDIVHKRPFFENGNPLCPVILRKGTKRDYLSSARKHLGREVGLDIFICSNLMNIEFLDNLLAKIIVGKTINYPGFNKLQNYVYNYTAKFLPIAKEKLLMSELIQSIVNYDFFEQKKIKEKIIKLLTETQNECKTLIEKSLG